MYPQLLLLQIALLQIALLQTAPIPIAVPLIALPRVVVPQGLLAESPGQQSCTVAAHAVSQHTATAHRTAAHAILVVAFPHSAVAVVPSTPALLPAQTLAVAHGPLPRRRIRPVASVVDRLGSSHGSTNCCSYPLSKSQPGDAESGYQKSCRMSSESFR